MSRLIGWKASTVAAVAGIMTGTLAGIAPAHAETDHRADAARGVLECRGLSCDYYLNRPATQQLAAALRRWETTSELPVVFAAAAACARVGNPVLFAACTTAVTFVGAFAIDQVRQADAANACLKISIGFSRPRVSAHTDGRHCTGERA